MTILHQPRKEIEFMASRLAEETAAAASSGETSSIHQQLAADYAAALTAYKRYAEQIGGNGNA